ncbi:glycosyltransferase [Cronobacter sp. JZ38]|uniref:glycosyltransferase n=1 Tax=Cronobacter sp. JZ38 TaxID=1906275 RepID=UPI00129FD316|nr:glycosyltransferase [Cronobacter sp. JZ38]
MNTSATTGLFSVLISVYKDDCPEYLRVALESVYNEQKVKPAQIVIVGDGQLTQELIDTITSFVQKVAGNIVDFFCLDKNQGLAVALNQGLARCKYDLVARMDADDISLPARFATQYDFMITHPEIDVCGTYVEEVESDTEKAIAIRKVPLTDAEIASFGKKRSPVSHPSVMFKKSTVLSFGGYPHFRKSQDFALWSLLLVNGAHFANIDQVLLKMRTGQELMARRGLGYLKYEYQVLKYQKKIKFINAFEFARFLAIRSIFRLLPNTFKKYLYNLVRYVHG